MTIGGPSLEYEPCAEFTLVQHAFAGAADPITNATVEDPVLVLVPCRVDFATGSPAAPLLLYDVIDEFEVHLSGQRSLDNGQLAAPLSQIDPLVFRAAVRGTLTGSTRIRSAESGVLGVVIDRHHDPLDPSRAQSAARNVGHQGARASADLIILPAFATPTPTETPLPGTPTITPTRTHPPVLDPPVAIDLGNATIVGIGVTAPLELSITGAASIPGFVVNLSIEHDPSIAGPIAVDRTSLSATCLDPVWSDLGGMLQIELDCPTPLSGGDGVLLSSTFQGHSSGLTSLYLSSIWGISAGYWTLADSATLEVIGPAPSSTVTPTPTPIIPSRTSTPTSAVGSDKERSVNHSS